MGLLGFDEFFKLSDHNPDDCTPPLLQIDENFRQLAVADFDDFVGRVNLDCHPWAKEHLCVQSLQGHAQNGHCMFNSKRFPNTTIEDVLEALFIDIDEFKTRRQQEINRAFQWVLEALNGKAHKKFMIDSAPLFGIKLFERYTIRNVRDALFGCYLGGIMDNHSEWREGVLHRFGYQTGGGECLPFNVPILNKMRIGLDFLSEGENQPWLISELEKAGAVSSQIKIGTRDIVSGFVRYKNGFGISDDAAFIMAGILYGTDAAMGLLLADAIDTWDKCAKIIMPGGQDEYLAKLIEAAMPITAGRDELLEFLYLSAVNPRAPGKDPDCSQRYFLQIDPRTNMSAVGRHLQFIESTRKYMNRLPRDRKEKDRQRIGFNRVWSSEFYNREIKPRVYDYILKGKLPDHRKFKIITCSSQPSQK